MTPVLLRLSPLGSDEPFTRLQMYEPWPPWAASVVEYAVPTVPPGSDNVVTARLNGKITPANAGTAS